MGDHEPVGVFGPDEIQRPASDSYEAPRFTVISLDCEISAYAPDDGDPLF